MYKVRCYVKSLRGVFPNGYVLTDNLDGVVAALDSMEDADDHFVIIELRSGVRTAVWWFPPRYVFEVIRPGCIFSKSFSKEALVAVLSNIESVAAHPDEHGFYFECY